MERLTGIPTFTQAASEFRYGDPIIDEKLCVFLSHNRVKLQIPWLLYV